MIRALLFDLDGTLTESSKTVNQSVVKILKDFGYDVDIDAVNKGQGQPFDRTIAPYVPAEKIPAIKEAYYDYYNRVALKEVILFPGVIENLEKLSGKYLMGLVTGKIEKGAYATLDALKLRPYFQVVVGGDTTLRGKPYPDPVHFALDALGVKPEEAIFIGDSAHDINAAKNSGVRSIGVLTGTGTREDFEALGTDKIYDTIADFFEKEFSD